jgi:fused signal recognition particle receptor
MFWRRKKGSDFITLGLNTPLEPEPEPKVETKVEPKVQPKVQEAAAQPAAAVARIEPVGAPVIVEEPVAEVEDEGFMRRFRRAVQTTRESISTRLDEVVRGRKQIDASTLDELEEILIGADIGVQTTLLIIEEVRKQVDRQTLKDVDELKRVIKDRLLAILLEAERARGIASETAVAADVRPYVLMVVGVNGTGKTTTIGKLAQRIKAEGNDVLICAADTFRAAASDQLAVWAERAGVPLIQQRHGTDPAAVLFDSLKAAKARNSDVLIVDTAGRLHNKGHLMAELEKMKRVAGREVAGAPHETLLVIDAVTGQNGLAQAREFLKAADVTGLVLTKLDGTAKGGIAVAIANDLRLPIRYVGVGEGIDDLIPFSAKEYVDALFQESW